MRTLVFNTVRDALAGLVGDPPRIYQITAPGVGNVPASPEKPFIIISEGVTTPFPSVSETSDAESIPYTVYAYDNQGSLVLVTKLLRKITTPVKALTGQVSPTGARCLGATWGGLSQDFPDPTYEASVRYASFVLVGSHHEEA